MKNPAQNIGDRAAAPWLGSRFRLISWMEILRFSADVFYGIGRAAGKVVATLELSSRNAVLNDETKESLSETVRRIRGHCENIGLTMSVKPAERLLQSIGENKNAGLLGDDWKSLDDRISDEIEDNLFLFIPKSHHSYYQAEQLFGLSV